MREDTAHHQPTIPQIIERKSEMKVFSLNFDESGYNLKGYKRLIKYDLITKVFNWPAGY